MNANYICTGIEGSTQEISVHSNSSLHSNSQQLPKSPSAPTNDSPNSTEQHNSNSSAAINSSIKVEERLQLYQQKYEQNRKSRQEMARPLTVGDPKPTLNSITEQIVSTMERIPKVEDRLLMEGKKLQKEIS